MEVVTAMIETDFTFYQVQAERGSGQACPKKGEATKEKARQKTGFRKNPPPLPCRTRSFEHVLLHVELAEPLPTSIKGASSTTQTHPGFVF
jgi:hypothetical protein